MSSLEVVESGEEEIKRGNEGNRRCVCGGTLKIRIPEFQVLFDIRK
jgi:hypothetical protein